LVAQCVQSVRQQGKDGLYSADPYFDAYYDPSLNRFSWIGTEMLAAAIIRVKMAARLNGKKRGPFAAPWRFDDAA
jgi:hypothetical protein